MKNNNNERKDTLLMEAIAEALVRQKRSSRILLKVNTEGTSLTLGRGEHRPYALPFTGLWVEKESGSSINYSKDGGFAGKATDLFYDLQLIPFLDEWDGITHPWEQQFGEQTLQDKDAFYLDHFDNGLAYRAFTFTPEGKEKIEGGRKTWSWKRTVKGPFLICLMNPFNKKLKKRRDYYVQAYKRRSFI